MKLLFMKPFRNPEILSRLETLEGTIELFDPKIRSERVQFVKGLLRDYRNSEVRYPAIETNLSKAITRLSQPAGMEEIKAGNQEKKELMKKL